MSQFTRRCPKCKSSTLTVIERSERTVTWDVEEGEIDIDDGALDDGGDITKVEARCECGHWWTLRGIATITQLIKEAPE